MVHQMKGWINQLANSVHFITCAINSPSTFAYYLELSNFLLESGLSYFSVLTLCILFISFVGPAGCHCFDLDALNGQKRM